MSIDIEDNTKEIRPTTKEDEENYFATNENIVNNEVTENIEGGEMDVDTQIVDDTEMEEECCEEFDKGFFLYIFNFIKNILEQVFDMLEKIYPNLREELIYCAPEILWLKVKHLTGVDIIDIMDSFEKKNKKCLKRKLEKSSGSQDEAYAKKLFNNM